MSLEREEEFNKLSAYMDFFATNVWCIDPAHFSHPTNVLAQITAKYGKSKALLGLKQAVNDTIEVLNNKSQDYKIQLDVTLKEKGIITFSEIQHRYSLSYKRILKRGVIRTQTEYYLINGIAIDLTNAIADIERSELQRLTDEYEYKLKSGVKIMQ